MTFPQPLFHDVVIDASWDGVIENAVFLDISLQVDALATDSRLQLISEDIFTDVDITDPNENSSVPNPDSETDLPNSTKANIFPDHDDEEAGFAISKRIASVASEPSENTLPQTTYISRIPLPLLKHGSLSPRKRPVPISERTPWWSPVFEDMGRKKKKQMCNTGTKRRISRSADGSLSPSKSTNERIGGREDPTRRGRQRLRADVARKVSGRALSEMKIGPAAPKDKIIQWLNSNAQASENCPLVGIKSVLAPYETLQTWKDTISIDLEALPKLPPSPSPSSQAAVPWTSVKYRNPLQIRGGISSSATLDFSNGFVYAVFPGNVKETSHFVRLQAKVHLREDTEKGGHVLELPGLPTQSDGQGHFSLRITNKGEGESDTYEKIAYIDENFDAQPLQSAQLGLTFDVSEPISVRLLRFNEPIQVLKASDFEVDYDIRASFDLENPGDNSDETIYVSYLTICSLRLREFLFWAKHIRFTIFITGGPAGTAKFALTPGKRRIYLDDNQCKAGHELEVTLTMDVEDLAKTFTFAFHRTLGIAPFECWVPRISKTSRTAHELLDDRDVEDGQGVPIKPAKCRAPGLSKSMACKKPNRDYSMLVQLKSLAAKPMLVWNPEDQLTPRSSARRFEEAIKESPGEDNSQLMENVNTSAEETDALESSANETLDRRHGVLQAMKWKYAKDVNDNAYDARGRASLTSKTRARDQRSGTWRSWKWSLGFCLLVHYLAATNIGSKAIESVKAGTWESVAAWRAECVPNFEDESSWKHLLAKMRGEPVPEERISTGDVGNLQEDASAIVEVPGVEQELADGDGHIPRCEKPDNVAPVKEPPASEQQLSFRDQLDRALGWRGPTGEW